jgi:tetratricopeptide (TPR) repeat protein
MKKLLAESHARREEANKLFASASYSDAISTYDRALASCPNYLDYEVAVLRSNIAACYLKLEDWKSAVDAATASIECLDRCLPAPTSAESTGQTQAESQDSKDAVIELSGEDEEAELERLKQDDQRRNDIKRIRAKALMRRARARTELAGWSNLQGAEDDYKELAGMDNLPHQDKKIVQKALRELPSRVQNAREKEMADMMGKLKDVSSSREVSWRLRIILIGLLSFLSSLVTAFLNHSGYQPIISNSSKTRRRAVIACNLSLGNRECSQLLRHIRYFLSNSTLCLSPFKKCPLLSKRGDLDLLLCALILRQTPEPSELSHDKR